MSSVNYHPNGYNISKAVEHFHSLTHYQLTLENGLVSMSNRTFDLFRLEYINSLLTTFVIPQLFLIAILALYILHCWIIRNRSEEKRANRQRRQLIIQHPHHLPQHKTKKRKRLLRANYLFHWQMFIIGSLAFLFILYSIIWLIIGLYQPLETLREFIQLSNQSSTNIGNFNRTLNEWFDDISKPIDSNANQTDWLSRTADFTNKKLNNLYEQFYTNGRQENLIWFSNVYRMVAILLEMANCFSCLLLGIFLFVYLLAFLLRKVKLSISKLIMLNLAVVIVMMIMFGINLAIGTAISDYCSEGKAVMYNIVQHRIYKNNPLTDQMVRYYLYCGIKNRWDIEGQKNKVVNVLETLNNISLFNYSLNNLINLNGMKDQLEKTYDTLTCSQMNRLINLGLSQFCTDPVDTITMITIADLVVAILLMFTLFVITFKL